MSSSMRWGTLRKGFFKLGSRPAWMPVMANVPAGLRVLGGAILNKGLAAVVSLGEEGLSLAWWGVFLVKLFL